ncbi:amidohydrolase family protein [Pseudarthrobacter raffinosi]|uniref:amidohydrolase family protein n=1 Tax=Pseudarthrobacter raffinosi TaxID=2953651 RepID=UPI00208F8C50|nr:amidohydrolase family protein [Pseudarthrobacter sp. MDT3-9]MCO4251250.1 amidohydrolase [Pseudarthrobacter sp. MDT3-9]
MTGKVDVHHHFRPSETYAARAGWSLDRGLEEMDENGIDLAIGYAGPVAASDGRAGGGASQARRINEFSAEIVRKHPGRFGMFASLPMLDPEASLQEIAYAADELGADGFGVSTSYGNAWLGDTRFTPVLEELNRRGSILYVHPVDSGCATHGYESGTITGPWLEWPTNTARTILSLMVNHVIRDLPDIRFVFCHAGGVMPMVVNRIAGFTGWPVIGPERLKEIIPDGIGSQFARLYFDMAQALAPETFQILQELVPTSHLMFGTDWDNFPMSHSVERLEALHLDPESYEAVAGGNARLLFGRHSLAAMPVPPHEQDRQDVV